MKPDIRAIIFDFGGVFAQFYRPDKFREQESRLGLETGTLSEILWRSNDWRLAEVGKISHGEYWRRTGVRLGLRTEVETAAFAESFLGDVRSDPRMVDLVRTLRQRYRVALLSNGHDAAPRFLREQYGLEGLFDVEVISALVGLAKPDPAIFRLALARLGTTPQTTIFVDDNEGHVAAAASLGIYAIHFTGYEALLLALQGYGVLQETDV